jgi:hypothetical protein
MRALWNEPHVVRLLVGRSAGGCACTANMVPAIMSGSAAVVVYIDVRWARRRHVAGELTRRDGPRGWPLALTAVELCIPTSRAAGLL